VTWNGTTITDPVLIFHDEVLADASSDTLGDPNRDGALVCSTTTPKWHITTSNPVVESGSYFVEQIISGTMSRLAFVNEDGRQVDGSIRTDAATNGLWQCRSNYNAATEVVVGLYARGGKDIRSCK